MTKRLAEDGGGVGVTKVAILKRLLRRSRGATLAAIATDAGRCRSRLTRLVALSCLAPDIVASIVNGTQPAALTTAALLAKPLPLAWTDQRRAFGVT